MRWTGSGTGRAGRLWSRLRPSFLRLSSAARCCCIGWLRRTASRATRPRPTRPRSEALAATPESPENHLELAANLQHDGLFDAAEGEFRHVASLMDSEPLEATRAKLYLSEMLHELRRGPGGQ